MSIDLIVEVMDHAPADLTSGERMVLTVIAERANDKTRIAKQSSRWTLDTVAHRAGVKRTGLKSIFQGLARKGCEVRVPVKVTPEGKPVFAFEGTAVTFKIPNLAERGGHSIPTQRGGQSIPTQPAEGMPQHPRGEAVASERGGCDHPQSLKTLKEPSKNSSLSARTSVPTPRDPEPDTRERGDSASPEDPNLTWHQRLVIEDGCPTHLAAVVSDRLQARYPDRGPGWWRKVKGVGDLDELVRETVEAVEQAPHCGHCGGTGKTTTHDQWDQPIPADCPACTPLTNDRIRAFVAQVKGHPLCPDGEEGGDIPMPGTGWMACAVCRRKSGYVPAGERNQQPRSSERGRDRHEPPPPGYARRPDGRLILVNSHDPNIDWDARV